MTEIAVDLAVAPLKIANVYLLGTAAHWYLIDTGLKGEAPAIQKAVVQRFGMNAKPAAIVLTHGHADHAGAARELAEFWNVPVRVHSLELPYLTGRSAYPPPDVTAPGFLAFLSRFIKVEPIDLGKHASALDLANPFPGISGWRAVETPGHSPGHTSFFRQGDGALLAGDAFTTVNTDSLLDVLQMKQKVCRPPAPSTINWPAARESVRKLADLTPGLLAAGHGRPMLNSKGELRHLADHFPVPTRGRFASEAAQTSEHGIVSMPPAGEDNTAGIAKSVLVAGLALGFGAAYPSIQKRIGRKK